MRSLVLRQPGTLLAHAVAATGSLLLPVAPGDAPLQPRPGEPGPTRERRQKTWT
jgi:hypothetical protein